MGNPPPGTHESPKNSPPPRSLLFSRWAAGSLMVLCALIALLATLAWQSRDAMASLPFLRQRMKDGALAAMQTTLVDQSPWTTAQALAALAVTQEELAYAGEAKRLADHDVDQAFAAALRASTLQQKTLTGDALKAQQRVTELEAAVAQDQAAVKNLTPKGGDDLDVAQAQLGLDQDELADAREDLARASGDQRGEIQQELSARDAELKKLESAQNNGELAVISVRHNRTLVGLLGAWQRQDERYSLLLKARDASEQSSQAFRAEHNRLEAAAGAIVSTGGAGGTDRIAGIRRSSLERQLMGIYNDRADTEARLADVYGKWATQVTLQHRIAAHLILIQIIWIAVILIVMIVLCAVVRRAAEHESLDLRRMRTLSRILRLAIQVAALVCILLVVFGPPSQLSTLIGLATAGLTVALQDFILAFIGWFILMGRNGIGVGDVVEIDGVAGEVDEIGLFKTTLLETGNWTANGHPTGRRVAFNNKYAISGKFFNFTTSGQWMWDELRVAAPADDIYATVERVQATLADATKADSALAEEEWRRASGVYSLSQFSAEPAVNLRPSGGGVDLVIRYVTRASGRFERRNMLYQLVMDAVRAPNRVERSDVTAPVSS